MSQKIVETVSVVIPLRTNFNTSASVVFVRNVAGIITAAAHHVPDTVDAGVFGLVGLAKVAAMFLGVYPCEVVLGQSFTAATGTFDPPAVPADWAEIGGVGDPLDQGPFVDVVPRLEVIFPHATTSVAGLQVADLAIPRAQSVTAYQQISHPQNYYNKMA